MPTPPPANTSAGRHNGPGSATMSSSLTTAVFAIFALSPSIFAGPPLLNITSALIQGDGGATISGGGVGDDAYYELLISELNTPGLEFAYPVIYDPQTQSHYSSAYGSGYVASPSLDDATLAHLDVYLSASGSVYTGPWNFGPPRYEWVSVTGNAASSAAGSVGFTLARRSALSFGQFLLNAEAHVASNAGQCSAAASLALLGSDEPIAVLSAAALASTPSELNQDQQDLQYQMHIVEPGDYSVALTTSASAQGTASNVAFVQVQGWSSAHVSLDIFACQSILSQPQALRALPGDSAQFNVQADGFATPTLAFTWRRDGVTLDNSMPGIFISSGQYSSSLSIQPVTESDGGTYDVVVSGPYCGDLLSDPALLSVVVDPVPGDLDGDADVDGADLGLLLGYWGAPESDFNGDGTTDGADLGILLGGWTR